MSNLGPKSWWRAAATCVLLVSVGCSIGALGSLFSPLSSNSTVPGPKADRGEEGQPVAKVTIGTNVMNGVNGAVGQLRIYGNGSAGDATVTQDIGLFALVPSGNVQFRNLTINAGVTLTVPSGSVLRC